MIVVYVVIIQMFYVFHSLILKLSKYIDNDSVTSDVDLCLFSIDDDIRMMLDDDSTEDDELAEIVHK